KLRDGLDTISAGLRQRQQRTPEILHQGVRYKSLEQSITGLDAVTAKLASIASSLGTPNRDGSVSAGELHFTTRIVLRGSEYKRVGHVIEIMGDVAKTVRGPAPKLAQKLESVAAELKL